MKSIFISYAHADGSEVAELLYQRLTWAGFQVWKDDRSLPLGAPFAEEISKAVGAYDNVLLIVIRGQPGGNSAASPDSNPYRTDRTRTPAVVSAHARVLDDGKQRLAGAAQTGRSSGRPEDCPTCQFVRSHRFSSDERTALGQCSLSLPRSDLSR